MNYKLLTLPIFLLNSALIQPNQNVPTSEEALLAAITKLRNDNIRLYQLISIQQTMICQLSSAATNPSTIGQHTQPNPEIS